MLNGRRHSLRQRLYWPLLSKYPHRLLRCLLPMNSSNCHAIPPTGLVLAVRTERVVIAKLSLPSSWQCGAGSTVGGSQDGRERA